MGCGSGLLEYFFLESSQIIAKSHASSSFSAPIRCKKDCALYKRVLWTFSSLALLLSYESLALSPMLYGIKAASAKLSTESSKMHGPYILAEKTGNERVQKTSALHTFRSRDSLFSTQKLSRRPSSTYC